MPKIEAVFFDVGETIVDEAREYGTWADSLGVPRHTFSAVFGAVIARGGDYQETFQYFQPGFDLATERERRAGAGQPETFADENRIPMRVRAWVSYSTWDCESAWPVTRPLARNRF